MKIVAVMTTESRGGGEFAAVDMLCALAERGHETLMISNQDDIGRGTDLPVRPLHIGPKLARRTYVALAARTPLLLRDLRTALEREFPYDVLIVHYKKEQLLAALLPTHLRATLIWAEWGPVPPPLRRGLPRRLYLMAAARAATVMAVSAGTRASVIEVGVPQEKVQVVRNVMRPDQVTFSREGRDRIRAELGIPDDAFVVGCMSRFHPKKPIEVVIDAVRDLDEKSLDHGRGQTHLVLAGDGETESVLRARATPLVDRAHFIPSPRGYVAEVLSAFDVLVFCPSPTEGAPRSVILGMLAGLPCLSTGAEGVSDIITPEIGQIVEPEHDATALATALLGYIEDPQRGQRQGAAGRLQAERTYAAEVVSEHIEQLFERASARPDPVGR